MLSTTWTPEIFSTRLHELGRALSAHPDIELLRFEVVPPGDWAEVVARIDGLDLAAPAKEVLRAIYKTCDGFSLEWRLSSKAEAAHGVAQGAVMGELELVSLVELATGATFLDRTDHKAPVLDGLYALAYDQQMYATALQRGGDQAFALADDGSRRPLALTLAEWLEALFTTRGFHSFDRIVAGLSSPEALPFACTTFFGEAAFAARFTGNSSLALGQAIAQACKAVGLGCECIPARAGDPCDAWLVFAHGLVDRRLAEIEAVLTAVRGCPTVLDNCPALNLGPLDQVSWDVGSGGQPQYWPMLAGACGGALPWDQVHTRLANIVAATGRPLFFSGPRSAAAEQPIAATFADLALALDPAQDPEIRGLAVEAVRDHQSVAKWIDAARKALGARAYAGEVGQGLRAALAGLESLACA